METEVIESEQLDDLPQFLTVDELAELLRVNRKTLYEAIAQNEIPGCRRIGRNIRICRQTVLDWLHGQVRSSKTSKGGKHERL